MNKARFSTSYKMGAVALVFLIIGFQIALFVRRAAAGVVASHRDRPDTVYVVEREIAMELLEQAGMVSGAEAAGVGVGQVAEDMPSGIMIRKSSAHSPKAMAIAGKGQPTHQSSTPQAPRNKGRRSVESFNFNPNIVSIDDLVRLGFSPKQAQAIDSYRQKGGRFRRPSDFAKSYVVADSVFERLEPFIEIPKLDINHADSAAFDDLPGIGPYFASKMVQMRERLHGYSYPEQLMDIYNFDQERFDGLKDLITLSPAPAFPLWSLPEDSLALHPYIGRYGAHGVVIYRQSTPPEKRNVADLETVLKPGMAERLSRCRIN